MVKEAARLNKLLEVNNQSFDFRPGGLDNAYIYLPLCIRYGVRVVVSSDAHSAFGMGRFDAALRTLEKLEFPDELVVNATKERFEDYLAERSRRVG